jgi:hypothetical protein
MGTRRWPAFKTENSTTKDTFSWVYKSSTANRTRTATTHKNKLSLWASKVKTIAAAIMTDKRQGDTRLKTSVRATEERDKAKERRNKK